MPVSSGTAIRVARTLSCALLLVLALTMPALAADFDVDLDEGVKYRSRGGDFAFALGGRWHYDGADFRADQTRFEDDWSTRRLRLSLSVDVLDDWRFGAQYDLLDEKEPWELLWLRYGGYERLFVTAGQFPEPFGLEHLTSSNSITFLERALPTALTPGTNVGIALRSRAARWSGALGVFWQTYIGDEDRFRTREGMGLTGRVTVSPIARSGRVLHLGASASRRSPDDDGRVRFRTRPESGVTDVRLIDTGRIRQVDYFVSGGVEAAWASGPWLLQGEYIGTTLYREKGLATETFDGGYLYAGLLLTGERRPYSAARGGFGAIEPKRAYGAWEIALRRSHLDLNGRTILGGREDNLTWGINWYAHRNLRLMFNYIHVNTDAHAGDDAPDILQMRLQVAI